MIYRRWTLIKVQKNSFKQWCEAASHSTDESASENTTRDIKILQVDKHRNSSHYSLWKRDLPNNFACVYSDWIVCSLIYWFPAVVSHVSSTVFSTASGRMHVFKRKKKERGCCCRLQHRVENAFENLHVARSWDSFPTLWGACWRNLTRCSTHSWLHALNPAVIRPHTDCEMQTNWQLELISVFHTCCM